MAYFSKDFNQFFKELAANNNKEWFDENRDRYHKNIKEPFEEFVSQLIDELKKDDPEMDMDPKKAIFRINRDIRFSKDKSPYKLSRSAVISRNGKKDGVLGLYFELGPEKVMIAGGAYEPIKEELQAIREYIALNPKEFQQAVNEKDFKKVFGEILGEENKRLPDKDLMEAAQKEPIIFKKQFYFFAEYPPEKVTSDDLLEFIIEKYRASSPVRKFFEKALNQS